MRQAVNLAAITLMAFDAILINESLNRQSDPTPKVRVEMEGAARLS